MTGRLTAIIRKEFRHIVRDWQTLIIVLAMPLVLMFLYGYALDVNIQDVPVVVVDPSRTPESKALTEAIDNSELFKVIEVVSAAQNPLEYFGAGMQSACFGFPRFRRRPAAAGARAGYSGAH